MTRTTSMQGSRTTRGRQEREPAANQVQIAEAETRPARSTGNVCYWPAVDILDLEDKIVVVADMPGLTSEDIHVDVEHGTLTIHGVARNRSQPQQGWLVMEYAPTDWFRSFRIGDSIDPAGITARYDHGVLMLEMPKVETARPRRIQVK